MSGRRLFITSERFWQIAILTSAGAIGAASPAEANRYYLDYESGYYYRAAPPPQQPRRAKAKRPVAKPEVAEKETSTKPQAPLIITVSIETQKMRIYDANGFFAESPVSTGMKGHSTPTGVFSIIQKHKFHRSNLYSGAPMPYMQRITWSGVAMHAGVLPGYPASHGCIRLPMAFAMKLWNWTKMGGRVIITPGEISPASFSHPLLVAQKISPQPAPEASKVDAPIGVKSDKGADSDSTAKPITDANVELKSTVGHGELAITPLAQTLTADASNANAPVTMSDAAPASAKAEEDKAAAKVEASKAEAAKTDVAKPVSPPVEAAKADLPTAAEALKAVDTPDAKKDPARLPGTAKPESPKSAGQIAVFISGKDSKLYVRQNFAPLLEAAVTIAPGDRPLGTHVFTAEADKKDTNLLRWSAVSMPVVARKVAVRNDNDGRSARKRQTTAAPVEAKPQPVPNTPAEALDRITIPPETMALITEALATGGSIIVSDQSISQQGETGKGTDFIVPLR